MVCIMVLSCLVAALIALTPAQRQHMFNVERANLVAVRTMGSNSYMATVMQQNHGCGGGDDTDTGDAAGNPDEGESETPV